MYALRVYGYPLHGMSKPIVYTVRTSIAMRGDQRDELERHLPDIGLRAMLRDAGLRVIGRGDLVIDAGRDESGHRRKRKAGSTPPWVFVSVSLTAEQKKVLTAAAKSRSMSLSALLQDAARFELGLDPVTESAKGWKRGKRRSKPPKGKP